MSSPGSLAVIGGGIVGMAVARELTIRFPDAEVTVLEKEATVAAHQTGHNSGVVHAGLYYEPGSLKARLCRRGAMLMAEYAQERHIPFERCGKVVVALRPDEKPLLRTIFERSLANAVPGVALVGSAQLHELEPNVTGIAALHSPETAIIDYSRVTECLAEDVKVAGGAVILNTEVTGISNSCGQVRLCTTSGEMVFDAAIACGGLQSDRLAVMAGSSRSPAIVPFFGQYLQLEPKYKTVTNGLVYPVPDPRYPFLGIHLTKRFDGEMTIGPNAFLSLARERYEGIGVNGRDIVDVLREPGFWRFARQHHRAAFREFLGVMSKRRFVTAAAQYVPAVAGAETTPLPRGVRAQAVSEQGKLIDDFVIESLGNLTLLRNAPSPGATASLAIAEHVVDVMINNGDKNGG